MKIIGSTFAQELAVAGLSGLPYSWSSNGVIEFGESMSPQQIAAVEAVYSAHDPVASHLTSLRKQRVSLIEAAADVRIAAGLTYAGKVIQIDDASRQNIGGVATRALGVVLGTLGLVWPANFAWRTFDNSWLSMSAVEFLDMGQQAADLYIAIVVNRSMLKDAVSAASNETAIAAVDPSTGWPT